MLMRKICSRDARTRAEVTEMRDAFPRNPHRKPCETVLAHKKRAVLRRPRFAPEGAKQTLFLGAYIPMTPTMNGIQAAMISTRAIEGTTPVLNMSPKV